MNLAAFLTLGTSGFVNPLRGAQSAVASAGSAMKTALGGVAAAAGVLGVSFAAFKSVEGFVGAVESVAATGKELNTMSKITGTSVRDLVILRKAFKDAGLESDGVRGSLVMMQKAIGGVNEQGEPTKKIFEQMGLSIESLQASTTTQQLKTIGSAIAGMSNQSQKAAAVTAVFGRAGAEMLALFANPNAINEATAAVGAQAAMYQRSSQRFAELANTLDAIRAKVKGFFVGFTDQITPVLLPMLKALKKSMDFSGVGQQAGLIMAMLADVVKSGRTGEVLGLSLKIGFAGAVNYGMALLKSAAEVFGILMAGNIKSSMILLRALTTAEFWSGLGKQFLAAGTGLVALLRTALAGIMEGMSRVPGLGFLHNSAEIERGQAGKDSARAGELAQSGAADLAPFIAKSLENSKQTALAVGQAISKNLSDIPEIINSATDKASLKSIFQQSYASVKALNAAIPKEAAVKAAAAKATGAGQRGEGIAKVHEGDRLAKIGLFVGNGGPGADAARRTADNTGKLVSLLTGKQFNYFRPQPAEAAFSA